MLKAFIAFAVVASVLAQNFKDERGPPFGAQGKGKGPGGSSGSHESGDDRHHPPPGQVYQIADLFKHRPPNFPFLLPPWMCYPPGSTDMPPVNGAPTSAAPIDAAATTAAPTAGASEAPVPAASEAPAVEPTAAPGASDAPAAFPSTEVEPTSSP